MNDRSECTMCEIHNGKIYCSYYDHATRLCVEISDCPETHNYEFDPWQDGEDDDVADGNYREDAFKN